MSLFQHSRDTKERRKSEKGRVKCDKTFLPSLDERRNEALLKYFFKNFFFLFLNRRKTHFRGLNGEKFNFFKILMLVYGL